MTRRASAPAFVALALSAALFGHVLQSDAPTPRVGCAPVTTAANGRATVTTPDGPVLVPKGLANPAPACGTATPQRPAQAAMASLTATAGPSVTMLARLAPLPRLVQPIAAPAAAPVVRVKVLAKPRILRVPLVRSLHRGSRGPLVRELQRALIHRGIRPSRQGAPAYFGLRTRAQVALVQRRARIAPATGGYGVRTHRVMAGSYDARGVMVLRNAWLAKLRAEAAARARAKARAAAAARTSGAAARLVAYTRWAERNAWAFHYSQGGLRGTYSRTGKVYSLPQWLDCSMYVTNAYRAAGLRDPNGFGFNGYGYTGTLVVHGTRVFGVPRAGDLVFYGSPISHVAIATGGGYVSSHGSEPGPLHVRWNYRPVVSIHRYLPM